MIKDKFKVSGNLFKKILSHMDSLSRKELMELQAECSSAIQSDCSPTLYHIIKALDDLAKLELVNRDLIDNLS